MAQYVQSSGKLLDIVVLYFCPGGGRGGLFWICRNDPLVLTDLETLNFSVILIIFYSIPNFA
jgi:hypothetical protein